MAWGHIPAFPVAYKKKKKPHELKKNFLDEQRGKMGRRRKQKDWEDDRRTLAQKKDRTNALVSEKKQTRPMLGLHRRGEKKKGGAPEGLV